VNFDVVGLRISRSPSGAYQPLFRRNLDFISPSRFARAVSQCLQMCSHHLAEKPPSRASTKGTGCGLASKVVNDKGRYRQLRRERNLPNFSSRNRLQNTPKKRALGIVDVNVFIVHYLGWSIPQQVSAP
jgi:hypothetical protein